MFLAYASMRGVIVGRIGEFFRILSMFEEKWKIIIEASC